MFQIVTDACCDLPAEVMEKANVDCIPMILELEGKEYSDDSGKSFDYDWFLDKLKENAEPKTTQINVGRFIEFFRSYLEKKIPVLYLGFTSGMSGSYSSSLQAVEILKEEFPDATLVSLDTKAASLGQGMLVMEAVRLRDEGKSMEEIIAWMTQYKMHLRSWVTVNDLKQLVHGGRISKTSATVGGLLSIKPIITVDRPGSLQNVDKIRGRKKSIQKIIEETQKELDLSISNCFYIAHSGDDEVVETIVDHFKKTYPKTPVYTYSLGPTIASHTGYGCIALFSMGKKER
ncbi:MAG TPA: DegV family protein [Candidatus Tetragenococcus pullicola]|nr:DegV family protein [Candidatus Tetragenococcus pullicola]